MTSASTQGGDKNDFNLEIVHCAFKKCLGENENVVLEEYIRAFRELCRFFKLTGTLLGVVAMDLEHKIKGVEYHMHSQSGQHYYSITSMVEYEKNQGITHKKGPHPSGCRMLLRLHQALEFILMFMGRLREAGENEKMSTLAWEVYRQTLYHHHPWVTHKVAQLAVYALPSKKHLIDIMCKHDYDAVMELLGEVLKVGWPIYNSTQQLFSSHDLLKIP